MEGEVRATPPGHLLRGIAVLAALLVSVTYAGAQETPPVGGQAEISLRKTVNTKKYQGKDVEGEERVIGRGDSLWRILVEEKGLSGQKFHSYIVIIRGLNPQLKNLDILRIGDKVFIPLRPDETVVARASSDAAPAERNAPGSGVTTEYKVKAGEHLYQILRAQLKLTDERKLAQYYALVKDLNPERKNWDTLVEGEIIRLPTTGQGQENLARGPALPAQPKRDADPVVSLDTKASAEARSTRGSKSSGDGASVTVIKPAPASKDRDLAAPGKPAAELEPAADAKPPAKVAPLLPGPPDTRQALRAPAKENMVLFGKVVEAMGDQIQQSGEEVVAMRDETIRFDKDRYPVVYSPALSQRVVIDTDNKIPASLKTKLDDPNIRTPILSMGNGVSVQEAVGQLLARLGYQALPAERPVVIQEEGVTYEARGDWMALGPEESNKTQEVFVINLTDNPDEIPEYLKSQLAKRGLHFRDVVLAPANNSQPARDAGSGPSRDLVSVKTWPSSKEEMVDALLLSYGVPFGVAETLSVELRDGLRVDMRTDRIMNIGGKRTALLFRPGNSEVRKALRERQGVRTEELNIAALSSRELISKVLTLLGDHAAYREHRFPAADDSGLGQDRLTVKAWGFRLRNRPMFVTDRHIPAALHRFFFEKGLEIVYFQ